MSRNLSFKYDYPYCGYGDKGRFRTQWSTSRTTLNGCYTYPMVFNNTVPGCRHIKVSIEITNTGSGTIYGRSWDFMVYRQNYGWMDVQTFTLPDDGTYTVDCDIGGYNISQIAFVPSSNPGSSRTWSSWFDVQQLTVTESITTEDLITGQYQYGFFTNYYGLIQQLNEVYVNIGGSLKPTTNVFVNIDDALVPLPSVYSGYFKSAAESIKVFEFTVPVDGTYRIQNKRLSGDHEIRLYNSELTPLYEGYFYSESFPFTEGSLLYISLTHFFNNADTGESYLQIYKEA